MKREDDDIELIDERYDPHGVVPLLLWVIAFLLVVLAAIIYAPL